MLWSGCRPIVNLKPKWVNPLRSISLHDWTKSFCRRVKTPSAVWNHPQGIPKFTQLDYRHQRVDTHLWTRAIQPHQQSLYCTVSGHPLTTVMTLKTHLQWATLYHYSKKSSPIKSAKSMNLILKSKFQVLSVINQF